MSRSSNLGVPTLIALSLLCSAIAMAVFFGSTWAAFTFDSTFPGIVVMLWGLALAAGLGFALSYAGAREEPGKFWLFGLSYLAVPALSSVHPWEEPAVYIWFGFWMVVYFACLAGGIIGSRKATHAQVKLRT